MVGARGVGWWLQVVAVLAGGWWEGCWLVVGGRGVDWWWWCWLVIGGSGDDWWQTMDNWTTMAFLTVKM